MLRPLLDTMELRFILVTDEKIEATQRILEGKCGHCDVVLPAHNVTCPLNPNRSVLDKLYNIHAELDVKLNKVKTLIDKNQLTVEQLVELLDEIKLKKLQEEEE
jgi:hypothetical protein